MHAKVGPLMIAAMLCAFLAATALSPDALAQSRGGSGLPSGPGNPMADLQQQIDALSAQVAALNAQMVVFASQLALLGSSGALGVFDADGQRMGDVVGVQDNLPWVSMTAAGHTFVLQVFPGRLIGQFLWYSGPGCTGTVYISGGTLTSGPNVFSIAAVDEPGGTVYAADANAPVQRQTVQSVRERNGTCMTFSSAFGLNVVSSTPVMTLDTLFRRPYSVH